MPQYDENILTKQGYKMKKFLKIFIGTVSLTIGSLYIESCSNSVEEFEQEQSDEISQNFSENLETLSPSRGILSNSSGTGHRPSKGFGLSNH